MWMTQVSQKHGGQVRHPATKTVGKKYGGQERGWAGVNSPQLAALHCGFDTS